MISFWSSTAHVRTPVCDLIDTNQRQSGMYFTRLCDSGHMINVEGPVVAIWRTTNNKPDGEVSRTGVNLTPTELHKLSCIVRCSQMYNTTLIK